MSENVKLGLSSITERFKDLKIGDFLYSLIYTNSPAEGSEYGNIKYEKYVVKSIGKNLNVELQKVDEANNAIKSIRVNLPEDGGFYITKIDALKHFKVFAENMLNSITEEIKKES